MFRISWETDEWGCSTNLSAWFFWMLPFKVVKTICFIISICANHCLIKFTGNFALRKISDHRHTTCVLFWHQVLNHATVPAHAELFIKRKKPYDRDTWYGLLVCVNIRKCHGLCDSRLSLKYTQKTSHNPIIKFSGCHSDLVENLHSKNHP